jgi:hypothetical protein
VAELRGKKSKSRGVKVVEWEKACQDRCKCKRRTKISVPDENVDWGEFKTHICCNNDPHFGG